MSPQIRSPRTRRGSIKKSKCSEEQIATTLWQVSASAPIPEVTRALAIRWLSEEAWPDGGGTTAFRLLSTTTREGYPTGASWDLWRDNIFTMIAQERNASSSWHL